MENWSQKHRGTKNFNDTSSNGFIPWCPLGSDPPSPKVFYPHMTFSDHGIIQSVSPFLLLVFNGPKVFELHITLMGIFLHLYLKTGISLCQEGRMMPSLT